MSERQPLSPERALALCVSAGILQRRTDGDGYELSPAYRHDEALGPQEGGFYQHQDGGFYRYLHSAKSSENQETLYIYEHLWPFDAGQIWARPSREWAGRFTRVRHVDLVHAMLEDREAAQQAVRDAKAARRAREGKAQ